MRSTRLRVSRGWVAAGLIGAVLVAISRYFDGTVPTPYGYGEQTGIVVVALVMSAFLFALVQWTVRAERRRSPLAWRFQPQSIRRAAGVIGASTAAITFALTTSLGGAAFGAIVAVGLVATGGWGRISGLVVAPAALWIAAAMFIAYSVVDAWINPLPPSFVPIGGMDGFGQDTNEDGGLAIFFFVIFCAYVLAAQLVALCVVWLFSNNVNRPSEPLATDAAQRASLG